MIFILLLATIMVADCHVDVREYLKKFGYINVHSFHERSLNNSIKIFQETFGLPTTGVADAATIKLMNTPRCGVQDHLHQYFLRVWRKKSLSYSFDNFTPDMTETDTKELTKQALNYWASVSPLSFTQKDSFGDIRVAFGAKAHSDSRGKCKDDFDGPSGVLAHAFFPEVGRIHFDEDETFTARSAEGTNFLWVATHEMGHILGLDHDTENRDAVMYPYYKRYNPEKGMSLHPNDIRRIQQLYGTEGGGKLPPCEDKEPACKNFRHFCMKTSEKMVKWAIENCEKTCGYCRNSKGERCATECKDVAINCPDMVDNCFKKGGKLAAMMKRNCQKTCHYCC